MKPLTENRIKKNHKKYPEDKEVHEIIENTEVDRKIFGNLLKKGLSTPPFDKKK